MWPSRSRGGQVNDDGPYVITPEELDMTGAVAALDETGFLETVEAAKDGFLDSDAVAKAASAADKASQVPMTAP